MSENNKGLIVSAEAIIVDKTESNLLTDEEQHAILAEEIARKTGTPPDQISTLSIEQKDAMAAAEYCAAMDMLAVDATKPGGPLEAWSKAFGHDMAREALTLIHELTRPRGDPLLSFNADRVARSILHGFAKMHEANKGDAGRDS